jgi:hypothetical protein
MAGDVHVRCTSIGLIACGFRRGPAAPILRTTRNTYRDAWAALETVSRGRSRVDLVRETGVRWRSAVADTPGVGDLFAEMFPQDWMHDFVEGALTDVVVYFLQSVLLPRRTRPHLSLQEFTDRSKLLRAYRWRHKAVIVPPLTTDDLEAGHLNFATGMSFWSVEPRAARMQV